MTESGVLTQASRLYSDIGNQTWLIDAVVDADGHVVRPAEDSNLASIYHSVDCCKDELLLYQDQNNLFQLVNWTSSASYYLNISASPVPGSGMVLKRSWPNPEDDDLVIYYQQSNETLATILMDGKLKQSEPRSEEHR